MCNVIFRLHFHQKSINSDSTGFILLVSMKIYYLYPDLILYNFLIQIKYLPTKWTLLYWNTIFHLKCFPQIFFPIFKTLERWRNLQNYIASEHLLTCHTSCVISNKSIMQLASSRFETSSGMYCVPSFENGGTSFCIRCSRVCSTINAVVRYNNKGLCRRCEDVS